MSISIILPTYNEKGNIIQLIRNIIRTVKKITNNFRIYVVDDNSPDKTGEICKSHFATNNNVIVYIRKKRGFASAILYGIMKSKEDVIVVMDTDFSHNPKLIPMLVSKLKKFDMVLASRYVKNGGGENKKRYWMSKIYNLYLRYILRINISDFLFGFFCVKRKFLLKNKLLNHSIFTGFGDYFIRLIYYINKSGGMLVEVPAFYKARIYGVSKSDPKKVIITYTLTSLQLLMKDLFNLNKIKMTSNYL